MKKEPDIEETFRRVISSCNGLVRRMCWTYSSGDRALFEEMLQECRFVIWCRCGSLSRGVSAAKERMWVFWQCRSVFIHHRRQQRHWIRLDDRLAGMIPDQTDDGLRELVEELAEDLNAGERQVLALILDGYRTEEIAEILEMRARRVRTIRINMINKMRETCKRKNIM